MKTAIVQAGAGVEIPEIPATPAATAAQDTQTTTVIPQWTILNTDVLEGLSILPDASINCCVTSPPYWGLRDYGITGQIGMELSMHDYIDKLVAVFAEVRRVLRPDGILWLNLGDSYNAAGRDGHGTRQGYKQGTNRASANGADKHRPTADFLKPKDLCGIPWRVALALQDSGWWLRSDVIWCKGNPMPESVTDRPTRAHEYVFLMTKSAKYWYDADAVREEFADARRGNSQARALPYSAGSGRHDTLAVNGKKGLGRSPDNDGRNLRSWWQINPQPFHGAHFATFPPALVDRCILAGCPIGGTVLDTFCGSGTTGAVAIQRGRNFIGIELNPEYAVMAEGRIRSHNGLA